MDNVAEGSVVVRIPVRNEETNGVKQAATKKDPNSGGNSLKVLILRTKENQNWRQYIQHWKTFLLVSFVIGISTDPLFLYIHYVDEANKCIKVDRTLKIVALVLRCVTDISYLISMFKNMLCGFRRMVNGMKELTRISGLIGKAEAVFWMLPWSFILVDFPAILPIPQVIIFVSFIKLRGLRYARLRKFLNFLVLFQYVPRIIRIHLSSKKLGRTPSSINGVVWVKALFNLFLYITASHALGALWYFFSIERETACWRKACKTNDVCGGATASFDCNAKISRNVTILNEFCPINPPNATVFDFGIYLDALQSGIHISTDFPKKLVQCFWWGLRNLSSFGQNLKTSSNFWEAFFAALISIIGLLLFSYLIGNFQTYIQLSTTRSEKIRQKLKAKEPEIDLLLSKLDFHKNIKTVVKQQILYALEYEKDVKVEKIIDLLSVNQKGSTKGDFTMDEIQKLQMEQTYKELFDEKRQQTRMMERNVELWINRNGIPEDLKTVIKRHILYRLQDNTGVDVESLLAILPKEDRITLKQHLCLPILKKVCSSASVPTLQNMKEQMLESLVSYVKPVVYSEHNYIIRKGEPLDFVLFITQGVIWSYDDNGSNNCFTSFKRLEKGDYYGKDLLDKTFALPDLYSSFPMLSFTVRTHTKVEALVLTANNLIAFIRRYERLFSDKHDRTEQWASHTIQNVWRRRAHEKAQK